MEERKNFESQINRYWQGNQSFCHTERCPIIMNLLEDKEQLQSKLTDLEAMLEEKIEVLEKQNLHECQKKNKDFINDGKYLAYQEMLKEIGEIK